MGSDLLFAIREVEERTLQSGGSKRYECGCDLVSRCLGMSVNPPRRIDVAFKVIIQARQQPTPTRMSSRRNHTLNDQSVFQGFDARSLFWNGAPGVSGEEGDLFRDTEVALAPVTYHGISELKPAFALRICNKL